MSGSSFLYTFAYFRLPDKQTISSTTGLDTAFTGNDVIDIDSYFAVLSLNHLGVEIMGKY